MKTYLSFGEKLGFSIGEYSASIVWQTLMFFLPVFYTDTFGISAATAGTMFLVVRLFDAINDPLMGSIADNTKTRFGRFRPYLLWISIPYGLAAVLMFTVPNFDEQGKIIYAYITYTLMMVIYTAIMIPYNSMVAVLSPNPEERTTISSYKFVFAYAAGMTVQALVIPLVAKLGDGNDVLGYQYTMMIFGGICILFFLISFFSSKERVSPPSTQKFNLREDFKSLLSNKAWVILFISALLMLIYIAIRSSAIVYFFSYYLNDKGGASAFMVTGTIAVLLGVLPTKWLASKFGKKRVFVVSLVIIAISSLGFQFVGTNIVGIYVCQIVFSLASGPSMPLLWSMLADAADHGQVQFGRRNTALIYSAATLGQKAGFSIGGAFSLWILAWFGYVANVEQTPETIQGIRMSISVVPAIIAALSAIVLAFYPLNDSQVLLNSQLLNKNEE